MTPTPTPSYLVELFDPKNGIPDGVDVCAKLTVAMQKVYEHLLERRATPRVELSYDVHGQVEGVGFFDGLGELISCITVYHLARDTDRSTMPGIAAALELPEPARTVAMNAIFKF